MTGALNAKTRRAVLQIAEWQEGVVEMPSNTEDGKTYRSKFDGNVHAPSSWPDGWEEV